MKRLKIEPVINEHEAKDLKKNVLKDLSLDNDFLFSAYMNDELSGYIHLCPIQNCGLLIKTISYKTDQIAKQLIVEALKCGWEFGYSVAITTMDDPIFDEIGFRKPEHFNSKFKFSSHNILAYPLAFNGVDDYFNSLNKTVNKSA